MNGYTIISSIIIVYQCLSTIFLCSIIHHLSMDVSQCFTGLGLCGLRISGFADEGDDKAMSNDLRTYPPWESNIAMETSILDKLNCSKRLCMESFRCQAG